MITKQQKFIEKGTIKHNGKYDYSKVKYINAKTKVIIICPEHGEFEQLPHHHLTGSGCPECGRKGKNNQKLSLLEFEEKGNKIHNGKYDYSKVNFINTTTKVIIICPDHGEFEQLPSNHLNGRGCPECGKIKALNNRIMDFNEFEEKGNKVHNGKYDYSKVNYVDSRTKVIIICSEHGEFEQLPNNHLFGAGCLKCYNEQQKLTLNEWKEKSSIKHNGKYDYSKVNYVDSKTKVIIICPDHGEFEQRADQHLFGEGCPECAQELTSSKAEKDIYDYLKQINSDLEIQKNNRNIIFPKELDLYIPNYNLAIEFNGLHWHSEIFKEDNYHQEKFKECLNNEIRLVQIFEDEWLDKQDIVKDRLKNILGLTKHKIYARKCTIKKLENKDVRDFLNDNHIQGYCNAQVIYGLFYNTCFCEELVSLMSFSKPRINLGRKQTSDNIYELLRFVSLKDYSVIGGASKLLNHFIKEHKPQEIYSYCDLRWSQGNLYKTLGFEEVSISKPNYFYVSGLKRLNRFKFRKDILIKDYGCPQDITEKEFMRDIMKYDRIYDAGTKLFRLIM